MNKKGSYNYYRLPDIRSYLIGIARDPDLCMFRERDKNLLINNLEAFEPNRKIKSYKKGKYSYFHIGSMVMRVPNTFIAHIPTGEFRDRHCVNGRFDSEEYMHTRNLPYYKYILYQYYRKQLYSIFPNLIDPYCEDCYTPRPIPPQRPSHRQHNTLQDVTDREPKQIKNMITKEDIIDALAKTQNNVLVTGLIRAPQEPFMGIPVIYDNSIKVFIRKKISKSSISKRSLVPNKNLKFKWVICDMDEVAIMGMGVLSKSRLIESSLIKTLNSSDNCFNLQFSVISLGEEEELSDFLSSLKKEVVEKKVIFDLKGVFLQRMDKESTIHYVTLYRGVLLTFLISNCKLNVPSLKGFNIPKSRQKKEGSTAKIIRNKRTIFNIDEEVKILKVEKNLKTPQRHYFTVQSLKNPDRISVVYSHNLKVI